MRFLIRREISRRKATDSKLEKITQYVTAIRHLRFFALEDVWQDTILESRQRELKLRVLTGIWGVFISFTNNLSSGMFPVVAFWAYVSLAGKPLRVDVAFPALQLFDLLETSLREIPRLITVLLNARVAMSRVEDFMSEPDMSDLRHQGLSPASRPGAIRDGSSSSNDIENDVESRLVLENATFAWPGTSHPVLRNICVTFPIGLTLVCGKVGAGKTALLQAMLGELDMQSGRLSRYRGAIAYCSQTPWLQSMSIRENILFYSPYNEYRYRQVLQACALIQDLAAFQDGDLFDIGENGVGLSGGQKMRVALARAIYSRAELLLLDDPLSALDHHTAETIIRDCFAGSLMKNRTAVLVSHRIDICLCVATQMVEVQDGRLHILGLETSKTDKVDHLQSSESPYMREETERTEHNLDAVSQKFLEEEHRARGGVKATVYWEYIKAGKFKWWAVLICILSMHRLLAVGRIYFLKEWGEAYSDRSVQMLGVQRKNDDLGFSMLNRHFGNLPSPEVDIKPWLHGFLLFAVAQATMFLTSQSFMLVIVYSAGRQMFQAILSTISRATFRFYDVTPLGRLMNRMTSDISTVDGNISQQFQDLVGLGITWISSIVVIASVTPVFLIFSFALTATFVMIFLRFLPTSHSLRRLEVRAEQYFSHIYRQYSQKTSRWYH